MTNRFFAGQTNFIEELNLLDGESGDAQQAVDDHIADTTAAHAASAISNTPAGNIAATTVQAAINELDAAKANLSGAAFTGAVSATSFTGPLTGNASTATTLATARNINGVSFNGSADITVTAAAGTLTGNTLAAGVTASSLTSVGTLTALTVSGTSTLGVTRASGVDGGAPPQFGVSGTSKGVRIVTSSFGSAIEGVDNTLGGSYQPLNIVASAIGLYTTGVNTIVLGTNSSTPQMYVTNTTGAVNYLLATGSTTGNAVTISTGGSDSNRSISLTAAGTGLVQITNDSLRIVTSKTPASAAATGTQGQISWDADYIYVCTANNTWKRAALATW